MGSLGRSRGKYFTEEKSNGETKKENKTLECTFGELREQVH
jgi:hypothetical protein